MKKKPHAVAFDLDGTLVDTAPDLLAALEFALRSEDFPVPEDRDARNFIGGGARVMIERALLLQRIKAPQETVDRIFTRFLDFYEADIAAHSRVFPGVAEALDRLDAAGVTLVVCTNKIERLADKLLRAVSLRERFAFVAGGDTFTFRKPDPRHLTEAVLRAGGDPERSVMVGDSETDVLTAKTAELPVIAVSFGYTTIAPAALGADRLVHRFADVATEALALLGKSEAA
jgi:phosphoglycolate phosphatase